MPFGDRTGPLGQGPMTGRGLGLCGGGIGFRRGWFGRGRGWRNWYRATGFPGWQRDRMSYSALGDLGYTDKEEKEMVKEEMNSLKEQIKVFEDRLEELRKKK